MIRHDEVEAAVTVIVGELGPHAGARLAVAPNGDTGCKGHFTEASLPVVVKQKVRYRVIGHEHIRQPVIVVIADGDTQAVADVSGNSGLGADIGEDALAVVAIQHAGETRVVEWMAIDANAALR